jgi:hypothetical protein
MNLVQRILLNSNEILTEDEMTRMTEAGELKLSMDELKQAIAHLKLHKCNEPTQANYSNN